MFIDVVSLDDLSDFNLNLVSDDDRAFQIPFKKSRVTHGSIVKDFIKNVKFDSLMPKSLTPDNISINSNSIYLIQNVTSSENLNGNQCSSIENNNNSPKDSSIQESIDSTTCVPTVSPATTTTATRARQNEVQVGLSTGEIIDPSLNDLKTGQDDKLQSELSPFSMASSSLNSGKRLTSIPFPATTKDEISNFVINTVTAEFQDITLDTTLNIITPSTNALYESNENDIVEEENGSVVTSVGAVLGVVHGNAKNPKAVVNNVGRANHKRKDIKKMMKSLFTGHSSSNGISNKEN